MIGADLEGSLLPSHGALNLVSILTRLDRLQRIRRCHRGGLRAALGKRLLRPGVKRVLISSKILKGNLWLLSRSTACLCVRIPLQLRHLEAGLEGFVVTKLPWLFEPQSL